MKISKQERREAKRLFRSCLANGLLDEGRTRQAVQMVVAQRPRGYLAILTQFQRLVKLDLERRSANVESAVALSDQERTAVIMSLGRKYGSGLSIAFKPSPELIGGLRIGVGSDVYDSSVRGRLERLRESFEF
jgi:F-type H+-transporting ATPase subunit delta